MVIAKVTLVLAPVLAFRALPLPGIVTLALIVPAMVLAIAYTRSPQATPPLWQWLMISVVAASVLWSDDPAYSAERLRTYVPLLLATVMATAMLTPQAIYRCLQVAFGVIVGSSIIALVLNSAARVGVSGDFTLHAQFAKNAYGAILTFALALVMAERRRINLLVVPCLGILIALNRSVTAWAVSLCLIGAVVTARWIVARVGRRSARPLVAVVAVAATGLCTLILQFASNGALRVVGKNPTLSDRTEIWAACWNQIRGATLLGHGAFDFLDAASNSRATLAIWSEFGAYKPPQPHNGLLDLWGQLGLVGVMVFVVLVMSVANRAMRAATDGAVEGVAVLLGLLYVVMFGITESTYLGPWLVLTLACAGMVPKEQRFHTEPSASVVPPYSEVQPASRYGA